jgi:signal transduction histidine kinase
MTTSATGWAATLRRPSSLRFDGRLLGATVLTVVVLLSTSLAAIVSDHGQVSDHTVQTARNLSQVLREHARRTFGELDRVLLNLGTVADSLVADGQPDRLFHALTSMTTDLTQADGVLVTGPAGQIMAATAPLATATAAAVATLLSQASRDGLTVRYLGDGSGGPGEPGVVAMARPFGAKGGRPPLGWTVAILDHRYFETFYQSLDIGSQGLISVIHASGPILYRSPPLDGAIGTDVSARPLFTAHLAEAPTGTFRIRTGTDRVERIQAYATVDGLPLVVLVGLSTEQAYAAWLHRSLWLGGLAAVATLVVIVLATLLGRQVRSLQDSEERTRQVDIHLSRAQAIAHVGSWEWDLQANHMWWSPELHRIYGLSADGDGPSYGRFLQAVHPEDRAAVVMAVGRALDDGQGFTLDYRVRRADGEECHVRHEGQCELDAEGHVARMDSVVQDTTEGILLQARLAQAGKLSTLGEMAAGMAHELSQPLNILRMSAEGALLRLERVAAAEEARAASVQAFQQVSDQADRMAQIIDHIRLFSRKDTAPTQVFDARAPVALAAKMMEAQLAEAGVRLTVDLPDQEAPVKGRPVQLEQVVVNLLANAKESILARRGPDPGPATADGGGQVTLRMQRLYANVEIVVEDDGTGVPAGLFGRIFEPFFSTKTVGEGTGLGLSVSYGIVTGMGGTLVAGNQGGGGAAFEITLPIQVAAVPAPPAAVPRPAPDRTDAAADGTAADAPRPAGTGRHVLAVEDDLTILEAMRDHFEQTGYRVSTASGGDMAWRRFVSDPADVVVTDLRMGAGDGECLIRRLREVDPFLPIVVVSAEAEAAAALGGGSQDPNTSVLTKPVSLTTLGGTVEAVFRPATGLP